VVLAIAELSRTITRFHQNDDNFIQAMRTFQRFTLKFQPEFVVDRFDELSEMEIRSKSGASCRRLPRWKMF
jgi:hypothetical protein